MHEKPCISSYCLICWELRPATIGCKHCGRSACDECLRSFLSTRILQGNIGESQLACPNYDCKVPFPLEKLEEILSEETYVRIIRLRRISAVNQDPKRCWCPNRECGQAVDLGRSQSLKLMVKAGTTCGSCGRVFCPRCGDVPHCGKCPRDASYTKWVSKTERTGEEGVQSCPRCHHHIEKRGGCQHMCCSMCSAEWCWICRCPWSEHHMASCKVISLYRHKAWGNGPVVRTATMTAALPLGICVGTGVLAAGTVAGTVAGIGWVVGMTGYFVVVLPGKSARASTYRAWQRTKGAIKNRRAADVHADVPEDEPEQPVVIF